MGNPRRRKHKFVLSDAQCVGYVHTFNTEFRGRMPFSMLDETVETVKKPRPDLSVEQFLEEYLGRAAERPWEFEIALLDGFEDGDFLCVVLQPSHLFRTPIGANDYPEYKYGYELPVLIFRDRLNKCTSEIIKSHVERIVSLHNLSFLPENGRSMALCYLFNVLLMTVEYIHELTGNSSIITRGYYSDVLKTHHQKQLAALSEEDRMRHVVELNRPAISHKFLSEYFQHTSESLGSYPPPNIGLGGGIWMFKSVPYAWFDYDLLELAADKNCFNMPEIRVPLDIAKIANSIGRIVKTGGLAELKSTLAEQRQNEKLTNEKIFRPSSDHRSVMTCVGLFDFSPLQSEAFKILRKNYPNSVGQHTILTEIDSKSKRLVDVFRPGGKLNPAWGKLIISGNSQGTFCLNPEFVEK